MTETKQRLLYFDVLRVVATLFVVVLHACSSNFNNVNVYSPEWKMFNFYDAMSRWTVPMFIMLSGGLFLSRPTDVKKLYSTFYDYNSLNVLLETLFVFRLFQDVVPKLPMGAAGERMLLAASKYSFGVYLIHPFVLDFLQKCVGLHTLSFTSVLSVPAVSVAAFVMSYVLSYVLNKIPLLNKYIV